VRYEEVVAATNEIMAQYDMRLTVRQIYYRLVSPPYQLFENTARNYKGLVSILVRARENGDVDWRRIEDRARTLLNGESSVFDSPEDYINWLFRSITEKYYDRSLWNDACVEVWVEKDALASLVQDAASSWRVSVFPSRGYSSLTKVMEALERFPKGKKTVVLHLTDHDPSGLDMTRDLTERFERYAHLTDFYGEIHIKRIALTMNQVRRLHLPPNPTKRADARAPAYVARYGDMCWELDALPPDELQRIVNEAISGEVDIESWKRGLDRIRREREAIGSAIKSAKPEIERAKEAVIKRVRGSLRGGG